MNLLEIIDQSKELEQKLMDQEGELTPELEQELNSALELKQDKIDRVEYFMQRLENEATFLVEQAEHLAKRAQVLKNKRQKLEEYIKTGMLNRSIKTLQGRVFTLTVTQSPVKLTIDEQKLPDQYLMQVTTTKPDRERIKQALQNGETVEGVELSRGWHLRR